MKNKILRFIKQQWILVWILSSVLVISGLTAYASYETASSNSKMKRVVSAIKESGMMFSSNYLVENGMTTYAPKYVSDSGGERAYDIDVYLWNYSTKTSKSYPIDIDYDLTAILTDLSGTALSAEEAAAKLGDKSILILDENGSTVITIDKTNRTDSYGSQTLATSETADKYVIRYPADWDLDDTDVCIQLKAEPNNGGDTSKYKDLKAISAVLGIRESVVFGTQGWDVYVVEKNAEKDIADCAAYNVVASGSGESTVKILWNPAYLGFNEYFYSGTKSVYSFETGEVTYTSSIPANDADDPEHVGWSRIVIAANANEYRNRYDIQLYKVGGFDPQTWSALDSYLIMSAE